MATERTRKKIVEATMALAQEMRWQDITLAAIAERAKIDLAALRDAYDSKLAILEDFARRIDLAVLKTGDDDMADEIARERLFDVIMRRFDALAPYKPALRSLDTCARRDPVLALSLGRIASISQSWMLTAAGIDTAGLLGQVKSKGLVLTYTRVFRIWLGDDDPGLARTMSALDRELRRGETIVSRLGGLTERFTRRKSASATSADEAPDAEAEASS